MDENVQPKEDVLPASPETDTLKEQLAAEKDKYVRLLAEFENMRKRQERERMELIKYAHEEVIIESLKIYDDLERSLAAFVIDRSQVTRWPPSRPGKERTRTWSRACKWSSTICVN